MSDSTTIVPGSIHSNHPFFVAAHKEFAGVAAPGIPAAKCSTSGCTNHTYDWREGYGSDKNSHGIRAPFHQHTIGAALAASYQTEAHFCSYALMRDGEFLSRQPRVRKNAVEWLRAEGFEVVLTTFMADVDTPDHTAWTPELKAEFKAMWINRPESMKTCGVYFSPRGYRLIQPLASFVPVEQGEDSLHGWLQELVAAGVWESVLECKDWTRLMRTPNYAKRVMGDEGEPVLQQILSPSWAYADMVAIEPPKNTRGSLGGSSGKPRTYSPGQLAEAANYKASVANFAVPNYTTDYPKEWQPWVVAVGDAIRDNWRDGKGWRDVFMALSGALARNPDCDVENIPALIGAAHLRSPGSEHLLMDRQTIAHHAIERVVTGYGCLGIPELSRRFPEVLEAHLANVPRYFGFRRLGAH
jgi:hypothetical protein